jgi:hypothetical protein
MRPVVALLIAIGSLIAPATASAARVGHEPDGRIVYRAAHDEVDDVDVRPDWTPFARTLLYTASAALLTPGPGCLAGPPVACEARDDAAIYLGNRDDRAAQRVDARSRSSVYGEAGDDDIFSGGGQAYADGGAGADRVTVSSGGDSVASGGRGNDDLRAISTNFAVLYGDDGADALNGSAPNVRLFGGTGPDTITGTAGFGIGGLADAGPGDDRITLAADGSSWRIDAGTGHDTITVTGSGSDNIVCGPGWDVANVGPEDVVAPDCEAVHGAATRARARARARS